MNRQKLIVAATAILFSLSAISVLAQDFVVTDIGPNNSDTDAANPNGASGGRVNGLAVDPGNNTTFYAASEWGGLFTSTDSGQTWAPMPSHVPKATWDIEVDPSNARRLFATSYYDGRVNSLAGINVSTDGGTTWNRPATAIPPAGFCATAARRNEPSAFGISIDPATPNTVFVGTNCGLAVSNDRGANWAFIDPTPGDGGADDIFDVVTHNGGIIDVCGLDGHLRSVDGGATWTTAAGFPRPGAGRCSLAISPDESWVIFIVDGTTFRESNDGGVTWTNYGNLPGNQGRQPFVATNDRSGAGYDLWSGDVSLFRAPCTTPAAPTPGGGQRCPAIGTWVNSQTGAHNDVGDIAFDSQVAVDSCPMLFSNDGGIYVETQGTSPACHNPAWEQPTTTPHALWVYDLAGAHQLGVGNEDVHIGQQDTGAFLAPDAPAAAPTWNNSACCDVFDVASDPQQSVSTLCCFNAAGVRFNQVFVRNTATGNTAQINNYPAGNVPTFNDIDLIASYGPSQYVMITTTGVFVTGNINATPITWTQLGRASSPGGECGIQVATSGGTPTFFIKSGGCVGNAAGSLWSYTGTGAGGTWQQITRGGASNFGVYAVDPNDPLRIVASDLSGGGVAMVESFDGGASWQPMPALDNLMTGGGAFALQTQRGPTRFQGFGGYAQPSMLAISQENSDMITAGAIDAGVFLSSDGGASWGLITDPVNPAGTGVPHIPRPAKAYFDHEPAGTTVNLYVGTVGRGVWRITLEQFDGALAVVPTGWSFDFADQDHHIDVHSLRILDESVDTSLETIDWRTVVRYEDKNDDDDYAWEVEHTVIGIADAFFTNGETEFMTDGGGAAAADNRSVTDPALVGFDNAVVVLRGWTFDYDDDDHHIDHMSIRLSNVSYDAGAGTVSWTANARYSDKNNDDDYRWRYQFQVLAFNNGGSAIGSFSGSDGGGSDTDNSSVTNTSLSGFSKALVLPMGWQFDYDDDDHHIDRTAFGLRNISYDPPSGTVNWTAALSYHDKNSDDDYDWAYDVVVIAFDDGGTEIEVFGPHDDDGGQDERSATVEFTP